MTAGLDGNFHTETLKIDDRGEHDNSSDQVHDVGQVLSVEGFLQSAWLVVPCQEEMEKCNHSTFKLRATTSVDGGWAESSPDNVLTNVGRNEERDTRTQSVSLLEKFIKKNDNKTSDNKLEDEQ